MRRWRNRQKRNRKGHDRAAAPRDRGSIRAPILRPAEETIPRERSIGYATSQATFRARTQASDRWRNRQAPTIHFAAKLRATDTGQKIPQYMRLARRSMVRGVAPPKRAGEKSGRIGSASRSTTTLR